MALVIMACNLFLGCQIAIVIDPNDFPDGGEIGSDKKVVQVQPTGYLNVLTDRPSHFIILNRNEEDKVVPYQGKTRFSGNQSFKLPYGRYSVVFEKDSVGFNVFVKSGHSYSVVYGFGSTETNSFQVAVQPPEAMYRLERIRPDPIQVIASTPEGSASHSYHLSHGRYRFVFEPLPGYKTPKNTYFEISKLALPMLQIKYLKK